MITFLACENTFVSHVTGTTTHFGRTLATSDWKMVLFYGALLGSFYFGAVISACMTEGAKQLGKRSKYVLPLVVEAILILAFMLFLQIEKGQPLSQPVLLALLCIGSVAMGIQNATITKISGSVVRTTHLTGVLTDMGLESVQYLIWYWTQHRGHGWTRANRLLKISFRHPTILRLLVLYSIFGSFLFGAVAGAIAFNHIGHLGLVVPIAFLFLIMGVDWQKPIADIGEIDSTNDPDLRLHGILHALLPEDLAIYRIKNHRQYAHARAPNFQLWIDRLPLNRRVVILVLTPWVKIDGNAILDMNMAADKMRSRGGQLILGAVSPLQYRAMDEHSFIEGIGPENVWPDLEFAIARGVACTRTLTNAPSQATARRRVLVQP
ncbi:MAG: DUF1275 domain-containing protein [Planctomycetes bacterium]|nr:DUF1275 domain-containing protein [Planctomycetota bacterium]